MMIRPALLACLLGSLGATAAAQTSSPGISPLFATFANDVTVTANVAIANEYRYRGIGQTNGRRALQGGFDLVHASGFSAGNWNSNISWLSDSNAQVSSSLEMDVYGGYKATTGPVAWDMGVLHYAYPGSRPELSAAWLDTNADRGVYTNTRGRYLGKGMVLISLVRTF